MHSLAGRRRVGDVVAAVVLGWVCGLGAQSPTPEPTPKFDVQESALTAQELAEELGYKFYGNTWKFSEPTFVRARMWSAGGWVSKVPEVPPPDARWHDVYAPERPQREFTVRVLQKTDERSADGGKGEYTHIEMNFKINASGKDAPRGPEQIGTIAGQPVTATLTTAAGMTWADQLGFVRGPHQHYDIKWRHNTDSLGLVLGGFGKAVADAVAHPDRPDQQEAAEATVRDQVESGMRAAPITLFYFKGELSGRNNHEEDNGLNDGPHKRVVCVVTLECSREPFKPTTAAPTPADETQGAAGN